MKRWIFKKMVVINKDINSIVFQHLTKKITLQDKEGNFEWEIKKVQDKPSFQESELDPSLFNFLKNKNLILELEEPIHLNARYEKNYPFFQEAIRDNYSINEFITSIENEIILILGCGGLGTVVLDCMLRAGFKKFILIDGDKIEISNLNRQLFLVIKEQIIIK
ncbi:ThiF family adenylyltransferase [Spiroplasma chinense]|uniref:ThiF family adenylyltransferase n=1 Tax=Spiroplasma chinense TaxID=216932 RepID=A0A5B9Y2S5_9MOLU|nr:ThiF family adenylyltransferase [Spiroplasma chinense]QEH61241.1 ThiF family adenylyltransferase [Spiroplasma chinense]